MVGRRAAFTLVELLLVILILGVMVMIAVPSVTAIMEGTSSGASLRMVMQMGRYTRSMALLHQAPCDLVINLDKRTLSTELAEKSSSPAAIQEVDSTASRLSSEPLYESGATATVSFGRARSSKDREADSRILQRNRPSGIETDVPSQDDDVGGMAESIHMEQDIPGTTPIVFLGHTDSVEPKRMGSLHGSYGETNGVFRIRYHANGTCRPYRIAIGLEDDEQAVVTVDAVGTPRVTRRNQDYDDTRREEKKRW